MRTPVPPRSLTTPDLLAELEAAWWVLDHEGSAEAGRRALELEAELEDRAVSA